MRQLMLSLKTTASTLWKTSTTSLRGLVARLFSPTTQTKACSGSEKLLSCMDIPSTGTQSKNTQSSTVSQAGRSQWDTFTESLASMPESTEVWLAFVEGTSQESVRCVMRRTDWERVNGVLAGSADMWKVATGKSGKYTESGINLFILKKHDEAHIHKDRTESVSERNDDSFQIQEGDRRAFKEGILLLKRHLDKVRYRTKNRAKKVKRSSRKRKA